MGPRALPLRPRQIWRNIRPLYVVADQFPLHLRQAYKLVSEAGTGNEVYMKYNHHFGSTVPINSKGGYLEQGDGDVFVRVGSRRIEEDQAKLPSSQDLRRLIRARRMREEIFGDSMFADPAWDMLLELYASERCQASLTVSALCAGSAVPATTALRWIKALEGHGYIERRNDHLDRRRVHLSLTTKARELMETYFLRSPMMGAT